MNLYRLVYASQSTTSEHGRDLSRATLDAIARESEGHNRLHEITGVLVHAGGCFLQQIEGALEAIDMLYGKICRDPRHTDVTLVVQQPIATRRYGSWSMAVVDNPVDDPTRDLECMLRVGSEAHSDALELAELMFPSPYAIEAARVGLVAPQ